MGSVLSFFTTRILGYALAATVAVGAAATGWEWLGKVEAEKAAQKADTARAEAVAQAAALSATLATQNAAVDALKSTLASKQAAVDAAQAQVAQLSKQSAARVAAIQAAAVPADCGGAVGWLENQLGSAGE